MPRNLFHRLRALEGRKGGGGGLDVEIAGEAETVEDVHKRIKAEGRLPSGGLLVVVTRAVPPPNAIDSR